ncbi:MAG: MFS transporter, partial [Kutzneria sp.]|nr:MFS transporter [Kutzneria sp.]
MDTDTAASLRLTPRQLIRLVAVVNGVTIANLYYCQPLLPQIALSYAETPSVGNLTATGQLGYALGLILLVPLGDIVRRRRLVCLLLCVDAVALVATATAPTVEVLLATGVVVGAATSSVVQILLPYAATLAAEHERGRVVATVLSASLSGILLSRAVAGLVGQFFGWPTVFLAAAAVSLVLSGIVVRFMTPTAPEVAIGYRAQLGATLHLAMSEPLLRRR